MKNLKTIFAGLMVVGFMAVGSMQLVFAFAIAPTPTPPPPLGTGPCFSPGCTNSACCSVSGCAGSYVPGLGCTNCPGGNACFNQGNCSAGRTCVGASPPSTFGCCEAGTSSTGGPMPTPPAPAAPAPPPPAPPLPSTGCGISFSCGVCQICDPATRNCVPSPGAPGCSCVADSDCSRCQVCLADGSGNKVCTTAPTNSCSLPDGTRGDCRGANELCCDCKCQVVTACPTITSGCGPSSPCGTCQICDPTTRKCVPSGALPGCTCNSDSDCPGGLTCNLTNHVCK